MQSKVSVIILNFNGKTLLPLPLDSLKKLRYPRRQLEIIVVDNGSSDGSLAYLAKQKGVKVIKRVKNEGYSAFNHGIEAATGEFMFLVNNDLSFHPDCITELVNAYKNIPNPGLLAPLVSDMEKKTINSRFLSRAFYGGGRSKPYTKNLPHIQEWSFVGFTFFHRSLLKKLGEKLWDPDYFLYAEDIDISLRVRMLGLSVVQVNTAEVYHMWDATISKHFTNPQRIFLAERNLLTTFIKDADTRSIILYTPYVIATRLASIIRDTLLLRWKIVGTKIRAYWWNIVNLPFLLKKRRAVQSRRKVPDSAYMPLICDEKRFIREQLGLD